TWRSSHCFSEVQATRKSASFARALTRQRRVAWRTATGRVSDAYENVSNTTATRLAPFEGDAGGFAVPGRRRHTVIAQLVLEDAADRIAREVVAELDVARNGEVRDALDAPLAELGLGERDVRL